MSAGLGRQLAWLLVEALAENERLEARVGGLAALVEMPAGRDRDDRHDVDQLLRQLREARAQYAELARSSDSVFARQRRALDLVDAKPQEWAAAYGLTSAGSADLAEFLGDLRAVLDPDAEDFPLQAIGAEQRIEFLQQLIVDALQTAHGMGTKEPLSDPADRLARMVRILSNK